MTARALTVNNAPKKTHPSTSNALYQNLFISSEFEPNNNTLPCSAGSTIHGLKVLRSWIKSSWVERNTNSLAVTEQESGFGRDKDKVKVIVAMGQL